MSKVITTTMKNKLVKLSESFKLAVAHSLVVDAKIEEVYTKYLSENEYFTAEENLCRGEKVHRVLKQSDAYMIATDEYTVMLKGVFNAMMEDSFLKNESDTWFNSNDTNVEQFQYSFDNLANENKSLTKKELYTYFNNNFCGVNGVQKIDYNKLTYNRLNQFIEIIVKLANSFKNELSK